MTLKDYLRIIYRHKFVGIGIFIVFALSHVLYVRKIVPQYYKATTQVMLNLDIPLDSSGEKLELSLVPAVVQFNTDLLNYVAFWHNQLLPGDLPLQYPKLNWRSKGFRGTRGTPCSLS